MYISIFSDELALDITKGLPIIKSWGLDYVDLRGRVFGAAAEALTPAQLADLKKLLADHGMRVGCLQSSLAKVHLPDADRCRTEAEKLESIIRAAEALDCRLVRSFHFWQPPAELRGELAVRPDLMQQVLDRFTPLAERAREAGLIFAFENCGVTPDEVFAVLDALDVPGWGLAWDAHNNWDCDERRADENAFTQRMVERSKLLHVKARGAIAECGGELIPYDKILDICNDAGLPGPVSAETHNPVRTVSNEEMSHRVVQVIQNAWPTAAPGSRSEASGAAAVTRPWQDDPVRFVVVGLGMGHNRARQIVETPGTRLLGVCDRVEERARRTGETCDVPYTTDLRPWLDDDAVEVVFVLTETGRHAEIALQALEAGKHVMTTKPMESSLAACDEMIRLAEAQDRILAVDFEFRHRKSHRSLKAAVERGRLGRLLSGSARLQVRRTMEYFQSNGGWRGTRRWDGGGVLSNQAIHHIDEFAFTVGIPSRVRCDIFTQNHDIEAEDLGTALWLYDDGLVVNFTATTSYPQPTWYCRFELTGTEGAFYRVEGGPFADPVEQWYIDGTWSSRSPEVVESEWLNSMDNFAAHLRAGAPLTCPGRGGRQVQSVLDAMYRSAYEAEGRWVEVDSGPAE